VLFARLMWSKAKENQKSGLSLLKRFFHVIVLFFSIFVLYTAIASAAYLMSLNNAPLEALPVFLVSGIVAAVLLMLIFKRYTLKLAQWNAYLTLVGLSFLVAFWAVSTEGAAMFFSLLSGLAFFLVLTYTGWLHTIGRQLSCGQKGRAIVLMLISLKLIQQISWYIIHVPVHTLLASSLAPVDKIQGLVTHLFAVAHADMMIMLVLAIIAYILLFTRSCSACDVSSCGTESACSTGPCGAQRCDSSNADKAGKQECGQGACGSEDCGQGACAQESVKAGACKTDACETTWDKSCHQKAASCGTSSCDTDVPSAHEAPVTTAAKAKKTTKASSAEKTVKAAQSDTATSTAEAAKKTRKTSC